MSVNENISVDEVFVGHFASPLVQLVAGARTSPVQIHSVAQPGESTLASAMKALAFAYDLLETCGKQGADGRVFLRCEYADFTQEIGVKFQGDIGLHT